MERQPSTLSYWLSLICTILMLISRIFTALAITLPRMGPPDGNVISYLSFFHGAVLFFTLAIASWCRTTKS